MSPFKLGYTSWKPQVISTYNSCSFHLVPWFSKSFAVDHLYLPLCFPELPRWDRSLKQGSTDTAAVAGCHSRSIYHSVPLGNYKIWYHLIDRTFLTWAISVLPQPNSIRCESWQLCINLFHCIFCASHISLSTSNKCKHPHQSFPPARHYKKSGNSKETPVYNVKVAIETHKECKKIKVMLCDDNTTTNGCCQEMSIKGKCILGVVQAFVVLG